VAPTGGALTGERMMRERVMLLTVSGACSFLGSFAAWRMVPTGAHAADPVNVPVLPNGPARPVYPDGMDRRFELVARQVMPAVVAVEAVRPPSQGRGKPVEESGSGVLVRLPEASGIFALTNNHVIAGAPAEQITLSLSDNRVLRPSRVWTDPESDIAVLRLDETNLPTASLGESDNARVGQWVLAFGSPFGLNQTVTHGILSARERGQVSLGSTIRIKDFLQTDAAINPGSSGGPLVDLEGNVIGINTAIASTSGNNTGVSFSIPINRIKRVSRELLRTGSVSRGYLGLQVANTFDPATARNLGLDKHEGALVEMVYPDTPAAIAGIRPGDVVLKLDNRPVKNENHCINLIADLLPGQRVKVEFWRNRQAFVVEAPVGDWSQGQARLKTGQ